jgi:hypothetical protein
MNENDARRVRHERLLGIMKVLPTDYSDFGGTVERWADEKIAYPDCSGGCKWAEWLWDEVGGHPDSDWLVCGRPDGPRAGLLTFEHQAGLGCFEPEERE